MSRPLLLVTGNPGKLAEARRLFSGELESGAVDLPEIQSLDMAAILEAKGDLAWEYFGRPLVVEETGLELAGLNGFPGPLVKWMLQALGAEGMARAAVAQGDVAAVARCRLLYVDDRRRISAEGTCAGEVVVPARGDAGFGWDPIFQPEGSTRTYAEMDPEEKDALSHRAAAWAAFAGALSESGILGQR